jgi:hypothetical protein
MRAAVVGTMSSADGKCRKSAQRQRRAKTARAQTWIFRGSRRAFREQRLPHYRQPTRQMNVSNIEVERDDEDRD